MSNRVKTAAAESKRKALATGVAAAATVAVGFVAFPLAVVGAIPTAVLGWRWWKHRIDNGLRL